MVPRAGVAGLEDEAKTNERNGKEEKKTSHGESRPEGKIKRFPVPRAWRKGEWKLWGRLNSRGARIPVP